MGDARSNPRRIKWPPLIGGVVGIVLSAWLLESYGARRITELIAHAGWAGVMVIAAFHGLQVLCSALGWRVIARDQQRPLRSYLLLRWIREGVNNLLPLAQVGGEVVAWNLLRQRGAKLSSAIAGTVADLTMEMLTQILFSLLGVVLLLLSGVDHGLARTFVAGVSLAAILMVVLLAALRLGAAGLLEKGLLRLGVLMGWAGAVQIDGLNQALIESYRRPALVARSGLWHMVSWLLGGAEVCLALHFLGQDVGIETGLAIESLGQAAKALGFAVPGALGFQEGGYVIVCGAFGLSAEVGIALSLIKRLREVVLGIPALMAWQYSEARVRAAQDHSIKGIAP